jgi:type VI secretion system FHA domain protein
MQLSMIVLRCPDQVAPEARTVSGGEFHVGRGPDVDWVLPDPERLLSKRHFAVAFRGGGWQVADTSTNGTYLNTEPDAIGRAGARALRDGDRLRLGAYEIEVRVVDQPAQADVNRGAPVSGFGASARSAQSSPFGDPFADDPLAPSPAARRPFDEPAYSDHGHAPTSAQLPHDFDPLAPDHDEPAFGGGFRGPVQSDHSSSMEDAMIPPPIAGYSAPQMGGIIPGDDLLPDDWDKDLLEGIAPPGQTPASPAPFQPPPFQESPRQAPPRQASPTQIPAPMPAPAAFSGLGSAPLNAPPSGTGAGPAFSEPADFIDPLDPLAPLAEPRRPPMPATAAPFAASPIGPPVTPATEASPFEASPFGAPSGFPTELPEDFGDPLAPLAPPVQARVAESAPAPSMVAAPVVRQREPRQAAPRTVPADADPFNDLPRPSMPVPGPSPFPDDIGASPFDEPAVPLRLTPEPAPAAKPAASPVAAPPVARAAPPAVDDGGALAAFFKGAELGDANPTDPMAMMTGLGQAFRALVSGLRQVLIARATIKGEFRIEQTMIRARGNNPLKFSANDDDALTALLGVGRRTDMAPAAAIEDSLRDLRLHELATMAAMQVAVRAMLDELSPDKIRAGTDQGGMTVLPAQRKARAWDAFEARHAAVIRALVDDFDSIFGKSFARAYERALDEISVRERPPGER